jgi:hypothetical protein
MDVSVLSVMALAPSPTGRGRGVKVAAPPATAWAEGAQLNGRPFPATASAEGSLCADLRKSEGAAYRTHL